MALGDLEKYLTDRVNQLCGLQQALVTIDGVYDALKSSAICLTEGEHRVIDSVFDTIKRCIEIDIEYSQSAKRTLDK